MIAKIADVFPRIQLDMYQRFMAYPGFEGNSGPAAAEGIAQITPPIADGALLPAMTDTAVPESERQGVRNNGSQAVILDIISADDPNGELNNFFNLCPNFGDGDIGNIDTEDGGWDLNWADGYTLPPPADDENHGIDSLIGPPEGFLPAPGPSNDPAPKPSHFLTQHSELSQDALGKR